MNEIDNLIDVLLERHNHDQLALLAWCIGYIDKLERVENSARKAFGVQKNKTLLEELREELQ